MGFVVTNLVFYTNKSIVLITIIVNLLVQNKQTKTSAILMFPSAACTFMCVMPILFGRCLSVSVTVNFTRKLSKFLFIYSGLFIILAVVGIVLDCLSYDTISVLVCLYIVIYHAIICTFTAGFMYKTA
jgi:hypothetical protein